MAGGLPPSSSSACSASSLLRQIDPERAANSWSLVTLLAIPAGIAAYALVEYLQTRRLDSITRQFDTRTLVLMPVAMALNIVLGHGRGERAQDPHLPRFDRHHPGGRAGRPAGRRPDRPADQPRLDVPGAAALRQPVRRALRPGGRRHRPAGRHLRALGLAAPATARLRTSSWSSGRSSPSALLGPHGRAGAGRLAGRLPGRRAGTVERRTRLPRPGLAGHGARRRHRRRPRLAPVAPARPGRRLHRGGRRHHGHRRRPSWPRPSPPASSVA